MFPYRHTVITRIVTEASFSFPPIRLLFFFHHVFCMSIYQSANVSQCVRTKHPATQIKRKRYILKTYHVTLVRQCILESVIDDGEDTFKKESVLNFT